MAKRRSVDIADSGNPRWIGVVRLLSLDTFGEDWTSFGLHVTERDKGFVQSAAQGAFRSVMSGAEDFHAIDYSPTKLTAMTQAFFTEITSRCGVEIALAVHQWATDVYSMSADDHQRAWVWINCLLLARNEGTLEDELAFLEADNAARVTSILERVDGRIEQRFEDKWTSRSSPWDRSIRDEDLELPSAVVDEAVELYYQALVTEWWNTEITEYLGNHEQQLLTHWATSRGQALVPGLKETAMRITEKPLQP